MSSKVSTDLKEGPESSHSKGQASPDADVLQALGDGQLLGCIQRLHHVQQLRPLRL